MPETGHWPALSAMGAAAFISNYSTYCLEKSVLSKLVDPRGYMC